MNHIYLIFDNEDNRAGLKGALSIGKYLMEKGNLVYLLELPKPPGVSKIDLNEYLRDHTATDLTQLDEEESKSIIHVLMEALPRDRLKAMGEIKSKLFLCWLN